MHYCYAVKYRVLLETGNWAGYIDKDIKSQTSFTKKALKCLPNRLTPLYSKIYYKEENYLEVKTKLFIYLSPPHIPIVKVWVRGNVGMSVRRVPTFSRTHVLNFVM